MSSISDDNQAYIIEEFNSTSRYLDDLLNIDNPYFEGMVNKIKAIHLGWLGPGLFRLLLGPPGLN